MATPRPFDVRWTAELEAETSDLRVLGIKRTPKQAERYGELQSERQRWKARQRARADRKGMHVERDRPPLPGLAPVDDVDAEDEAADDVSAHRGPSVVDADADDVDAVDGREPFPEGPTQSSGAEPAPPSPEIIDARRAELRDDLVEAFEEWASEINPKPPRFLRRWTGKSLAAVAQKTGMLEHDVPIALAVILSAVGVGAFGVCTFIALRNHVQAKRAAGPQLVDAEAA